MIGEHTVRSIGLIAGSVNIPPSAQPPILWVRVFIERREDARIDAVNTQREGDPPKFLLALLERRVKMTKVDRCPKCGSKTRMGSANIITGDEEFECLKCHHIYHSNYFPHCKECGVEHVAEWLHWAGKLGFCSTKCYVAYMTRNKLWSTHGSVTEVCV